MSTWRLFIKEIGSVGFVDVGANEGGEVVFYKRQFTTEQRDTLAASGKALPDGSFPIATVADLRNAISAFGRASNKTATRAHIIKRARALGAVKLLPEGWSVAKMTPDPLSAVSAPRKNTGAAMPEFDLTALDAAVAEEVTGHISDLEKKVANLETAAAKPPPPKTAEDIAKTAGPEVQALFKAQADQIAKLETDRAADAERVATEIAKRRTAEFAKTAEPLIPLLGKPADIGPILEEIERSAPDAYAKLEPLLKAGAEAVAKGDLFGEFGHGEDAESDPIAKRDAWVAKQKADGSDKTDAELAGAFWKAHPDAKADARTEA